MKVSFTGGRVHKNSNDCWADALALALGITYRKAFNKLKEFKNDDGSMNMALFSGVLSSKGYTHISLDEEFINVERVIELFDTSNNSMVVFAIPKYQTRYAKGEKKTGHIVYVDNKTIYDYEDPDFLKYIVYDVYLKPGSSNNSVSPLELQKIFNNTKLDQVAQAMRNWTAVTESDHHLKHIITEITGKDCSNQASVAMYTPDGKNKK